MPSDALDAVPQGQARDASRSHYQREREKRRVFDQVIQAYLELSEYQPLVAINCDEFARTYKRSVEVSHFLCDVELATKRASATPDLYLKWQSLITGEQVEHETAAHIVNRCARIYQARELAPRLYFRTIKTARRRAV
jgi:hypothetical protein